MFKQISAVSTIRIDATKAEVLAAVWDIKSIEKFEVKADSVEVHPADERKGTYNVHGRFAGLPWRREFAYFLNEDGFYSRDARKSGAQYTVQGGFIVQPTSDRECTLIHYEMYYLSAWFLPVKPLISTYLKWSMRKELRDMKETIEGTRAQNVTPLHSTNPASS